MFGFSGGLSVSAYCGGLTLVTGPAVEPVSAAELKSHSKIQHSAEDTLISAWITSARQLAEAITGRAFVNQTWRKTLDYWPCEGEILFPFGRLQSITSITYVDTGGVVQTWSSALYDVDTDSEPGRVRPIYGGAWPSTRPTINAVKVTFVAGYGPSASNVPQAIRDAVAFMVADWYENRERPGDISDGARSLLTPYWVGEYVGGGGDDGD